ncbi:MAG: hypothetical protein AB7V26_09055 [Lysobacterales bacterium]
MTDELRLDDFLPLLGQSLAIECAGQRRTLELKEVLPIDSPSPRQSPPFSLTLRASDGWRSEQGIFRLDHPQRGALDIFFVPIGPDGLGLCYQAVFN